MLRILKEYRGDCLTVISLFAISALYNYLIIHVSFYFMIPLIFVPYYFFCFFKENKYLANKVENKCLFFQRRHGESIIAFCIAVVAIGFITSLGAFLINH